MAKFVMPEAGREWMTDEIRSLLKAIRGAHAVKKRTTVVKLAFARASQQKVKEVFEQEDTCAEVIWYQKWQHVAEIKAAYEACLERALTWRDEATAELEAHYSRLRRQSIAELAADAPWALADVMLDEKQKGGDRISAANALITWADPESAGKARPTGPAASVDVAQTVWGVNLAGMSEEELDSLLKNLEATEERTESKPAGEER